MVTCSMYFVLITGVFYGLPRRLEPVENPIFDTQNCAATQAASILSTTTAGEDYRYLRARKYGVLRFATGY